MIIISNKPGQLGNLLFIYANFLAYSFENNISLSDPAFYQYRSYFTGSSKFSFLVNRIGYVLCFILARVLFKLRIRSKFINIIALDNGESADIENLPALKSTFCFVQGWLFRSDKLLVKHKQKILDFFTPVNSYNNKITSFFKEHFQNKNELIIAIHIRHGDYKTFEGGKYYYSIEQYLTIIERLTKLFLNERPHFLICSNEKIKAHNIPDKDLRITFAPDHEMLDMYCMTKCNYIVGPPSTYSMWASFFGNVPLYMIHDINKPIELSDFKTQLT